jgi:hypothetical protein
VPWGNAPETDEKKPAKDRALTFAERPGATWK